MHLIAEMPIPALIVAWAAAGLAAAYLAWSVMNGGRVRLVGDSIAGVLGSMLGGFTAVMLVKDGTAMLGSVGAAFLGAWALVLVARTASVQRRI